MATEVNVGSQLDALLETRAARDDALSARDLAELWATEAVDVEVQPGEYSALHHRTKADDAQGAAESAQSAAESASASATDARDVAQTAESNAESAASNAATSASNASTSEAEAADSASDAEKQAQDAASAKSAAETAETEAKSARDAAQSAESGAETAETEAKSARDNTQSARDDALIARDDAEQAADDIGALGGIDGTVQTTSDLPSSDGNGDYFYVVGHAAYYKDTGSGSVQGGWEQTGPQFATGFDHVIRRTAQLETVFGGGVLTPGDKVLITGDGAPYRTTQWLDIDTSDVSVHGSGKQVDIKVADGANVGGFRIGAHSAVRNVEIQGVGFHGNKDGQTSGIQHHGFFFRDAEDCRLTRFYATLLHPFHDHNEGGSAVSIGPNAKKIEVDHGHIEKTGDRGIQMAGEGHVIHHNVIRDGFDRSISVNLAIGDKSKASNWYFGREIRIHHNHCGGNPEGSCIGHDERNDTVVRGDRLDKIIVDHNFLYGEFRGGVSFSGEHSERCVISDNVIVHTAADGFDAGIKAQHQYTVEGNVVIEMATGTTWNCAISVRGEDSVIDGNVCINDGGEATIGIFSRVVWDPADNKVSNNIVTGFRNGMKLNGTDGEVYENKIIEFGGGPGPGADYGEGVWIGNEAENYRVQNNIFRTLKTYHRAVLGQNSTPVNSGIRTLLGNENKTPQNSIDGTSWAFLNRLPDRYSNNIPELLLVDKTDNVPAGGNKIFGFGNDESRFRDRYEWAAVVANDPGDLVQLSTDLQYRSSQKQYELRVSEEQGNTGVDVRVMVKKIRDVS